VSRLWSFVQRLIVLSIAVASGWYHVVLFGMVQKKQTGLRIPEELLARVDAFAVRLQKEQPGLSIGRADAMRVLIQKGLEAVAAEKKASKR
jgi:hypothetical protein